MAGTTIHPPRAVAPGQGISWLNEGFGYFRKDALAWIGVTILLFVIMLALAFIPLLGNLASQILMPVFMGGLMLGCKARAEGGEFQVTHLFAGFSRHTGPLVVLGFLYLAGVIVLLILAAALLFVVGGATGIFASLGAGDAADMPEHLDTLWLVVLVVLALYLPLLMAIWFAPLLIVVHDASPLDAIKLSFQGCLLNVVPFLLYGLLGLVLSIIAAIPLLLGYLVLVPLIFASIFAAYRDIYSGT